MYAFWNICPAVIFLSASQRQRQRSLNPVMGRTTKALFSCQEILTKMHDTDLKIKITSLDELSSTRLRQLDCKFMLSCVSASVNSASGG